MSRLDDIFNDPESRMEIMHAMGDFTSPDAGTLPGGAVDELTFKLFDSDAASDDTNERSDERSDEQFAADLFNSGHRSERSTQGELQLSVDIGDILRSVDNSIRRKPTTHRDYR